MESINYKNVLCIGPSGNSEEAIACKNFIYNLLLQKINVLWKPIKVDETTEGNSELDEKTSKTKNKILNYSEVVLCCDPSRWDYLISLYKIKEDKYLIGRPYLTEEINKEVIESINNSKIKILSLFNEQVYKKIKDDILKDIFYENEVFNTEDKQIISLSGDWYDKEYLANGVFRWAGENSIINIVSNAYKSIRITSINEFNSKTISFRIKRNDGQYEDFHSKKYEIGEAIDVSIPISEIKNIQIISEYFSPAQNIPNNQDYRKLAIRVNEFYFNNGKNEFYQSMGVIKNETELFYSQCLDQELLVTQHDKHFSQKRCIRDVSVLDEIAVLITCHGDRISLGQRAYKSAIDAGIKNISIVISGEDNEYINWAKNLNGLHSLVVINEKDKNNNDCWLEGAKSIKKKWTIILHDDDVVTNNLPEELTYLNDECKFGIWNGSVENLDNSNILLENTIDINVSRGIYSVKMIRDLIEKYPLTISPIHGVFLTDQLVNCLEEWNQKLGKDPEFYKTPTFVVGNDIFIWLYFTKNDNDLCFVTSGKGTKCVSHKGSATEIDNENEKSFQNIYRNIKDLYISHKQKHGIILYLPDFSGKHLKCLDNLYEYRCSKYNIPIIIYSDSDTPLPSKYNYEFVQIPKIPKMIDGNWNSTNKYATRSFIDGLRIVNERGWDYFFGYEWDCKIGKDDWYDILWQQHLSWQTKPILTGTPVFKCPPIYSGNILQGIEQYRNDYAKQCKLNMLIENAYPLSLYSNGALTFYDTKKIAEYLINEINDSGKNDSNHMDKLGPWDLYLGIRLFREFKEKSFEKVAWLASAYSGCGDYFYSQKQRDYMLSSGMKVAVHQNKYT